MMLKLKPTSVVCPEQKEETSSSASIPVNDLKTILSLAREQYLKMIDSTLPSAASCLTDRLENTAAVDPSKKETVDKPAVFSHPLKATGYTYELCQTTFHTSSCDFNFSVKPTFSTAIVNTCSTEYLHISN